jgi:hypothetical protein
VASSPAGRKTPWTAPGTPYSYGPPTTVGTLSKLKIGGGDDTCHSSVSARQGLASARAPVRHERTMLKTKTSVDRPSTNDDSEIIRFQPANCSG